MAARHMSSPRLGFGPIGAVQRQQSRGERLGGERAPAVLPKESAQRLAEIAAIERLRRFDPVAGRHRLHEPLVRGLARRESDFTEQGRGLGRDFAFEGGGQLLEAGASDGQAGEREGGRHDAS